MSKSDTPPVIVGIAPHHVQGNPDDSFFWIGRVGPSIESWYDETHDQGINRGEIRWGHNGNTHGDIHLRGDAHPFWFFLLGYLPQGWVEEQVFLPKFPHLKTMIRIHLYNPRNRRQAIKAAKRAAKSVWGKNVQFVNLPPMS